MRRNGWKFFLESEKETRVVKGSTTTRPERVFLRRDGEYTKTTTTVEPDQEITETNTVHQALPGLFGHGKENHKAAKFSRSCCCGLADHWLGGKF